MHLSDSHLPDKKIYPIKLKRAPTKLGQISVLSTRPSSEIKTKNQNSYIFGLSLHLG